MSYRRHKLGDMPNEIFIVECPKEQYRIYSKLATVKGVVTNERKYRGEDAFIKVYTIPVVEPEVIDL